MAKKPPSLLGVGHLKMNNAILTSVLTIIGGVCIFVLGQILLKFFIEPIHNLKAQIGRVTDMLIFYADIYFNPGLNTEDQAKTASRDIRRTASDLMAKTATVSWYSIWYMFRILPKRSDVFYAHRELVGLSNGLFQGDPDRNTKRVEKNKAYLKLPEEILR